MPVIINAAENHPFLPLRGDHTAIDLYRAAHQDIRPLEILMINLMADKIGTERQLTRLLGDTEIQVHMTFAATDDYIDAIRAGRVSKNTPSEHIEKFYARFSEVKDRKFDGLVITGVNALAEDITKESIWNQVCEIMEWSKTHTTSSLFLCWGADAALQYFHDIPRSRAAKKIYGLFEHKLGEDKTGLLAGFPDVFPVPVSRWDEVDPAHVKANTALELTSVSDEIGLGVVTEPRAYDDDRRFFPYRVYVFNHPEYDAETLGREYARDSAGDPAYPRPRHYDTDATPANTWRYTGRLYSNWVRAVYHATPFDIEAIPQPYRRAK